MGVPCDPFLGGDIFSTFRFSPKSPSKSIQSPEKNKQKTVINGHPIIIPNLLKWKSSTKDVDEDVLKVFSLGDLWILKISKQNWDLTGERSCGCREAQSGRCRRRGIRSAPGILRHWMSSWIFYMFCWYIEMGRSYTKSIKLIVNDPQIDTKS